MAEELGNQPKPYYTASMWSLIKDWSGSTAIGVAVEIGAFRGEWSYGVLSRFRVGKFFAVDPWRSTREKERDLWDGHLKSWMTLTKPWLWRSAFPLRGTSEEWSRVFNEEIDLLYVDAKHNYVNTLRDLMLWYPKLRKGGLVIGHDYNLTAVKKACLEFFGKRHDVFDSGPRKTNRESAGRVVMNQAFYQVKP